MLTQSGANSCRALEARHHHQGDKSHVGKWGYGTNELQQVIGAEPFQLIVNNVREKRLRLYAYLENAFIV